MKVYKLLGLQSFGLWPFDSLPSCGSLWGCIGAGCRADLGQVVGVLPSKPLEMNPCRKKHCVASRPLSPRFDSVMTATV